MNCIKDYKQKEMEKCSGIVFLGGGGGVPVDLFGETKIAIGLQFRDGG